MFEFKPESLTSLWAIFEETLSTSPAVLCNRMSYDKVKPSFFNYYGKLHDYVRYRTFDLVAQEIRENDVYGAMAEAGVHYGTFARKINAAFPERTLYLFDTFEGFSKEQIQQDHAKELIAELFTQEGLFSDTSEELVLKNMLHPKNVRICKGLFEDTSKNIEEDFAFVSLDMDLYAPMLAGLEYFYPRMREGGYIFMHDYNHADIRGVKLAVQEYEKKYSCRLYKMPLPDEGGTVVIIK